MQGSTEYQPLTPFIEAIRGLALGTSREWNVQLAIIWGVAITIAGCACDDDPQAEAGSLGDLHSRGAAD